MTVSRRGNHKACKRYQQVTEKNYKQTQEFHELQWMRENVRRMRIEFRMRSDHTIAYEYGNYTFYIHTSRSASSSRPEFL